MQNAPQGAFTVCLTYLGLLICRAVLCIKSSIRPAQINFVHQLDEAAKHFAHLLAELKAKGKTRFEVGAGPGWRKAGVRLA
jgi:hypothetical protein